MLGTFILWFGWYGFNAGSAVDINSDKLKLPLIASAVVNSTLAGSAAGIVALFTHLFIQERMTGEPMYKLSAAMNGCLTGLVAITGGCGVVEPWAAIVIGIVAGLVFLFASHLLDRYCIDDAVDAIPVHLAGGAWGVIATGLFASPGGLKHWYGYSDESLVDHVGLFYSWGRSSGDFALMGCQIIGLVCILSWVTLIMFPFFVLLNYMGIFRADALEEVVGLDVSYHGYMPKSYGDEISPEHLSAYAKKTGSSRFYDLDGGEEDNEGVDRFDG